MDALRRIPALLSRQRRLRAAAGALGVLWILTGIHLATLAVLGWISLRFPLSPACLILMSWSYGIYLLFPFAYWIRWRARANAPESVARDLDRANPGAPDPFRTVLSLGNHNPETLGHLDRLFASFLPRLSLPRPRYFPKAQRLLLAAGILALVASALLSGRPGEFFRRASLPWLALDRLPTLRFDLDPSTLVLGAGDTARVQGRARNLIPGQAVYAYVRSPDGETRFPLAVAPDLGFSFAFGPAQADFSIYFAGDNGRSAALHYRVLAAPFLERMQAVLQPPAYTRLRADTLPQGVARFPVLAGTRVTWLVESDRALRRLAWSFRGPATGGASTIDSQGVPGAGNAAPARIPEDTLGPGKVFSVVREIRSPQDYSFWLEDKEGIRSRPMVPYRVDIIPDLAPEVDLVSPGADTVLDRDAGMPLAFRVKDDYGLTSLKLVYRVLADGKVRSEGQRDGKDWLRQARAGLVETEWDLRPLNLRPDNVVEFHLAAVDNDTVNGPKTGRSATRTLRMPTVQEVLAATRQKEQSAVANLKSAIQREKQLERKLEREKQSPREEGPPMLADYEINRIMVDDPGEHQRRAEATLAQLQQSMERQAKQDANGGDKTAKAGKDMAQAQSAAKEMQDFLKKSEPSLPRGNQGMLPVEERRKNLENLLKTQKEQAAKLAALKDKLEKPAPGKPQMDLARMQLENLSKDLDRNIQNQTDLQKMLQEQAAQAKAKSDMMDQAIQEQMRMAEDMKGANDDLKKSMEQGAKNGLLSPELMEKMKKVQELLKEVLPDSLQKLMESKLQGQEVNEEELREKLKEMLEKQAELAENLNRALAMLEQLKDRKRMGELKQMLGELQAREQALEKRLEAGQAGPAEDAEQKAIQQETQKALSDFSSQAAAGKKELQEMDKKLKPGPVQKDMQDVRQSLASASKASNGKSKKDQAAASASAAKSASSAADKLGEMGEMLGDAMSGMEASVDISEAQELLQESLALSRLQILIRSGSAKRQSEGWESDEAALYGSVAQTAQWLNERVKVLAAKVPFMGQALTGESRNLAAASREASRQYTWDIAEKSLRHNQGLSRELLKLLKMAQNSGQGSGSGSGSGSPSASGQSGGQGGDLSGQLQGMSGKQMAINQATYQLLKAMMEGRQPGPGQKGGQPGGQSGKQPGGAGGENGQGSEGGEGGKEGEGGQQGGEGEGSMGGMANKQGELGESLESLAEGLGEEGGSAQKIRGLADEARRLEEDLRQGRLTPEEVRRRQERFQSKLLEASNAMQERGQSESRQAETSRGRPAEVSVPSKAADEARMLQLLREGRKNAKGLRLSEGQRKYLDEYYESLLTR
ncbi:MAG: hypothetical protein JWO30_3566 [Fibrobacteres bacterium]|nr:hypothetical protein [Fibrobacterota bacterium]